MKVFTHPGRLTQSAVADARCFYWKAGKTTRIANHSFRGRRIFWSGLLVCEWCHLWMWWMSHREMKRKLEEAQA